MVYTVDCLQPETHVYRIVLDVKGFGAGVHELELPVWTPGAYEVQDYSRHVFNVKAVAQDGHSVTIDKIKKNVWRLDSATDAFSVTYEVYAYQLAVDTSHMDGTHAYWNGACLFFTVDGQKDLPIDLFVKAPPGWYVSTGLPGDPSNEFHFRAPDYDILIDSPVEVGTHRRYTFVVEDKPHTVAIWGNGNQDDDKLVQDTERIVKAQAAMFGGLPYRDYTFIYHVSDTGGGLEHLNSTTCDMPRQHFKPWKRYRGILSLISHEFFHLWNVKRIHPDMLGPFDYSQEVYTTLLWAMEGYTSYYGDLLLRRAELYSVSDYLEVMANLIKEYEKLPGRHVMDLSWSSFDTWIKLYKPNEDSPNRSISYYLKGELVGLIMDLEIRRRTANQKSLDDVLRLLFERYGRHGQGFPERAYQDAVETVAGSSMAEFFARYIHGVDELPFEEMLGTAGLELRRRTKNPDLETDDGDDTKKDENAKSDPPLAWLGIETKEDNGKILARVVYTPGPAAERLYAGDELIAINGERLTTVKALQDRLRADWAPGDEVTVSFFRRGLLESRKVTLGDAPPNEYKIVRVKAPAESQRATYESWLKEPWPADKE